MPRLPTCLQAEMLQCGVRVTFTESANQPLFQLKYLLPTEDCEVSVMLVGKGTSK